MRTRLCNTNGVWNVRVWCEEGSPRCCRLRACVFVCSRARQFAIMAHTLECEMVDLFVRFCVCGGHLVLGLASGLEAFSREPPCDSVGALAFRQTPETRGTAWEFLSYYPILPSRYLRGPFNNQVCVFTCLLKKSFSELC